MPCAAALRFSNAAALRFSNAERQAVAFFLRCLIVALAPTYCGLAVAQDNGGTIAGIMWGLEASASVSTYFGRFPDFSGTSASFSPITGCCWTDGAQPGSWYGYPGQGNLGMIPAIQGPVDGYPGGCYDQNTYNTSMTDIAAGNWDTYFDNVLSSPGGWNDYLSQLYYIRINWEWSGSWFCWSPFLYGGNANDGTTTIPGGATTWANATARAIAAVRRDLPGVKVGTDCPMADWHRPFIDPIIDLIDFCTIDMYFSNEGDPNWTSSDEWNYRIQFGDYMAAYAAAHNKPIVVNEWADNFNDGYCVTQFLNWMVANNVVAQSYWNADDNGCPTGPASCDLSLPANSVTLQAYINIIGSQPYTGSYWQPQKPIPPAIPNDIGF